MEYKFTRRCFLQDFAAGTSTLGVDSHYSQEYEDVECSQIYLLFIIYYLLFVIYRNLNIVMETFD